MGSDYTKKIIDADDTLKFSSIDREYLEGRAVDLQLAWDEGLRSGQADREGCPYPQYRAHGLGRIYSDHLWVPYQPCLDGVERMRLRVHQTKVTTPAEEEAGTVLREAGMHTYSRWLATKATAVPYLPGYLLRPWGNSNVPLAEDTSTTLYVTEAPVKALSLASHGFPAIAVAGVEAGYLDPAQSIKGKGVFVGNAELGRIQWRGRKAIIVYDSGIWTNPAVGRGAARLAAVLRRAGADVGLCLLPLVSDTQIRAECALLGIDPKDELEHNAIAGKASGDEGPDDYLARWTRYTTAMWHDLIRRDAPRMYPAAALRQLLDAAVPADPAKWAFETKKSAASAEERTDKLTELLQALPFQALVTVGGEAAIEAVARMSGMGKRAIREAVAQFAARVKGHAQTEDGHPCNATQYLEQDGATFRVEGHVDGSPVLRQLANLTASITHEVIADDGQEEHRQLRLQGKLQDGTALPPVTLPTELWSDRTWVVDKWGARAIVEAGRDTYGHFAVAVQRASKPEVTKVFTHTGWRRIGERWVYLLPAGTVGADNVEVAPVGRDGQYALDVEPLAAEELKQAIRASLSILDVGPDSITVPVLAAAYTAPLSSFLEVDFAIYIAGESGAYKSGLAALAQSHYGRFAYNALPLTWFSTANALEQALFRLKDCLVTIDNYVPGTARDIEEKGNRIIQQIGDRGSRDRLDRSANEKPGRPPRGLVISTGEDVPAGTSTSTVGRTVPVEVKRGDLDLQRIIAVSKRGDQLRGAMRAYLEWMAAKDLSAWGVGQAALRDGLAERYRPAFEASHSRMARAIANLITGFMHFMVFAIEVGALTIGEADRYRDRANAALLRVGAKQSELLDGTRPVDRYISAVCALLASGQATLSPSNLDLDEHGIGWSDGPDGPLYVPLYPDLVWKAVEGFYGLNKWPYTKHQIHRALVDSDYVLAPEAGRNTAVRWLGHRSVRVLLVRRSVLAEGLRAPESTFRQGAELTLGIN